jgi:protein arginine N-methyltransferase 1
MTHAVKYIDGGDQALGRGGASRGLQRGTTTIAIRVLRRITKWLKKRPAVQRVLHEKWSRDTFRTYYIHEIMLSDTVRVSAYQRAIQKQVTKDDSVLDLGTGTGLLAMLAAQKEPRKIYAIDHSDIIDSARLVAQENNKGHIEFLKIHSRDFNPPDKISVILHEQIGYYLFDEKFIENITDVRDRVLKRGGRIIPAKFDFFIEPMTLKDEYRIPFIWQLNLHGIRFDALRDRNVDWTRFQRDGSLSTYVKQRISTHQVKHLLCDPEKLFSIDLETIKKDDVPKKLHYSKTVTRDGRLDVLGIYFRVNFDDEISFDTSPLSPRTHFENYCVRLTGEDVHRGDEIEFELVLEDITVFNTWKLKYRITAKG